MMLYTLSLFIVYKDFIYHFFRTAVDGIRKCGSPCCFYKLTVRQIPNLVNLAARKVNKVISKGSHSNKFKGIKQTFTHGDDYKQFRRSFSHEIGIPRECVDYLRNDFLHTDSPALV